MSTAHLAHLSEGDVSFQEVTDAHRSYRRKRRHLYWDDDLDRVARAGGGVVHTICGLPFAMTPAEADAMIPAGERSTRDCQTCNDIASGRQLVQL